MCEYCLNLGGLLCTCPSGTTSAPRVGEAEENPHNLLSGMWDAKNNLLKVNGGYSVSTARVPFVGPRVAAGYPMPVDRFAAFDSLILFGGHATVPSKDRTVVRAPKHGKCTGIYPDETECGKETRMMCEDRCETCAEKCTSPACSMLVYSTKNAFGCITFKCAECRRRESSRR